MEIKIEHIGNIWKLIIDNHEFFSEEKITIEELTQLVITLAKFKGISANIDFTTKY